MEINLSLVFILVVKSPFGNLFMPFSRRKYLKLSLVEVWPKSDSNFSMFIVIAYVDGDFGLTAL